MFAKIAVSLGAFTVFLLAAAASVHADAVNKAPLEARVENMTTNQPPRPPDAQDGDVNWWHYDVVLADTSGRGPITVNAWKKCYLDGELRICERVRRDIDKLFGSTVIPKGGTLRTQRPAWVWAQKTGRTYDVVATYWAHDGEGKRIQANYRFSITSK